ncbi:MAG: hypothetical protein ACFFD1_04050 [Candidatus Thorarchaeota archaeon]
MEPYKHVVISLIIGIIGVIIYNDIFILLVTFIFGTFSDFDHYFEFINTQGIKKAFKFDEFYHSRHFIKSNRMILIFHAYEYLPLFVLVIFISGFNVYLIFAFFGYLSHLIMDQIGNYDLKWFFYFITVRLYYRFDRRHLVKKDFLNVTGNDRKIIKTLSKKNTFN